MNKIIAIDGPAGSGKGTIAAKLAEKLNLINIDTGATYRCLALEALRHNLTLDNIDEIVLLSNNIKIQLTNDGQVLLNGEDVTKEIREKAVTNIVSQISSNIKIRENMVAIQRQMANDFDVVMEGRDITTVVFPNTKYKFYLDASLEERVDRRYKENIKKNINMSFEEVYENIKTRDYNDMHKPYGALKRTDDQIYIDTTNMNIEEVVDIIINKINTIN